MRILLCFALFALALSACDGVEPILECDSSENCHDGYTCDTHTKTCLTSCAADTDCIEKSQLCDAVHAVCRTKCGENAPCEDDSMQCVDNDDSTTPVSTESDSDPNSNPTGICKGLSGSVSP